ncbi:MAG TPA: PAS domain S-box protein [Burkholderiales bacterium]|nr:PAS domain S-box protein [Burkholderiales bacterium]
MSEHWYRDVVDLSQDAIFVWRDGRFVFANRATASLLGAESPEALVGREVSDFNHPHDMPIVRERQRKLLAGGGSLLAPQEYRMIRADGTIVEVEAVATLFQYEGQPAAHVVLRNISERKALQRDAMRRIEEAAEHRRVQAERDYFQQVFEAMPGMAWTSRPDGMIDYVSHRTLGHLGLRIADLEGSGWEAFVHADDLARVRETWMHSVATGESYETEMRLRVSGQGQYRWHLSRAAPVRDGGGRILRWVGTTLDIHDQKEARAVLEQSHMRLAEAVRLRTEDLLGANAALRDEIEERKQVEKALRDSREKLRRLSAHLQSARETERAAVAREIHDELGATLTAAKMDLHWFAKTAAGAQEPRPDKLAEAMKLVDSAIHTVKRIATELRPSILDHLGLWSALQWQLQEFELNFGIACRIDPVPEGIVLEGEAQTAVFRIFQEALTNVARHAQASAIQVAFETERGGIQVRIRDNGVGLPPDRIMDPEACGLQGMRERARSFGGEVKFERPEGGGTTVVVRFPVRARPARRARQPRNRDREAV